MNGYVYILTCAGHDYKKVVKIGQTRNVEKRIHQLNTGNMYGFTKYATIESERYVAIEKFIHHLIVKVAKTKRVGNNEFFRLAPEVAADIFKEVAGLLGPGVATFRLHVGPHAVDIPVEDHSDGNAHGHCPGGVWPNIHRLANAIAERYNGGRAKGGIAHVLCGRRSAMNPNGHTRQIIEKAGIKFDAQGMVIDWRKAKNPLP